MKHPGLKAGVTRLHPLPVMNLPLRGLYLGPMKRRGNDAPRPFVYSNFITSLDGRIAIAEADRTTHQVPPAIANPRDWRLYQELAGQADVLITSGRYFRQSEVGEAQDQLPVSDHPDYADIREWRRHQGLPAQPDIAILSRSLAIPAASITAYRNRRVIVVTGRRSDADGMARLRDHGVEVITAGDDRAVDGAELVELLAERAYTSLYAIAGPGVLHTLLRARVLDRLYLTTTHQLLAGDHFDTLTRGGSFDPALGMRLESLYLDRHAPTGASQWFSAFEPLQDRVSRTARGRRRETP
jgi:riboflavin biosynthesis pyrimidine reductase